MQRPVHLRPEIIAATGLCVRRVLAGGGNRVEGRFVGQREEAAGRKPTAQRWSQSGLQVAGDTLILCSDNRRQDESPPLVVHLAVQPGPMRGQDG